MPAAPGSARRTRAPQGPFGTARRSDVEGLGLAGDQQRAERAADPLKSFDVPPPDGDLGDALVEQALDPGDGGADLGHGEQAPDPADLPLDPGQRFGVAALDRLADQLGLGAVLDLRQDFGVAQLWLDRAGDDLDGRELAAHVADLAAQPEAAQAPGEVGQLRPVRALDRLDLLGLTARLPRPALHGDRARLERTELPRVCPVADDRQVLRGGIDLGAPGRGHAGEATILRGG